MYCTYEHKYSMYKQTNKQTSFNWCFIVTPQSSNFQALLKSQSVSNSRPLLQPVTCLCIGTLLHKHRLVPVTISLTVPNVQCIMLSRNVCAIQFKYWCIWQSSAWWLTLKHVASFGYLHNCLTGLHCSLPPLLSSLSERCHLLNWVAQLMHLPVCLIHVLHFLSSTKIP